MDSASLVSVMKPKKIVKDLEGAYKKYSSMKAKDLREEAPSRYTRKADIIAYKLNFKLDWQRRSYAMGELQTAPTGNSSACEEYVKSALQKTIPQNIYERLHLDNLCIGAYIKPIEVKRAQYHTQKALLYEIMKKTCGVGDELLIEFINSFLTDYKGEVGNQYNLCGLFPTIHPKLRAIEYKPKPKPKPRRKIKKIKNITFILDDE